MCKVFTRLFILSSGSLSPPSPRSEGDVGTDGNVGRALLRLAGVVWRPGVCALRLTIAHINVEIETSGSRADACTAGHLPDSSTYRRRMSHPGCDGHDERRRGAQACQCHRSVASSSCVTTGAGRLGATGLVSRARLRPCGVGIITQYVEQRDKCVVDDAASQAAVVDGVKRGQVGGSPGDGDECGEDRILRVDGLRAAPRCAWRHHAAHDSCIGCPGARWTPRQNRQLTVRLRRNSAPHDYSGRTAARHARSDLWTPPGGKPRTARWHCRHTQSDPAVPRDVERALNTRVLRSQRGQRLSPTGCRTRARQSTSPSSREPRRSRCSHDCGKHTGLQQRGATLAQRHRRARRELEVRQRQHALLHLSGRTGYSRCTMVQQRGRSAVPWTYCRSRGRTLTGSAVSSSVLVQTQ